MEERAHEERTARLLSRLDDRGKREIEEIDAALDRIGRGTYGACTACGGEIGAARLEALPATALCVDCARERERAPVPHPNVEPARAAWLPPDLDSLSDSEVEEAVRARIREHGRIDTDELRILCRRGVAFVDGTLPSEAERQMLLHLLSDAVGLREIVDRVRIREEGLWEKRRRQRQEPGGERPAGYEPPSTSDAVLSAEEGIDYEPPDEPGPEEE
jgi:hypothetical protein